MIVSIEYAIINDNVDSTANIFSFNDYCYYLPAPGRPNTFAGDR